MTNTTPKALVDVQIASSDRNLPSLEDMICWASAALQTTEDQELTIRIVDEPESQSLNNEYRAKNKATNVLSFPFEAPDFVTLQLLGDLVICAPIVREEAQQQNKSLQSHWAHMIIHGTLHLQGYDHVVEADAHVMESLEVSILASVGFDNPYFIEEEQNTNE